MQGWAGLELGPGLVEDKALRGQDVLKSHEQACAPSLLLFGPGVSL